MACVLIDPTFSRYLVDTDPVITTTEKKSEALHFNTYDEADWYRSTLDELEPWVIVVSWEKIDRK